MRLKYVNADLPQINLFILRLWFNLYHSFAFTLSHLFQKETGSADVQFTYKRPLWSVILHSQILANK
jgi:hypothetical protein